MLNLRYILLNSNNKDNMYIIIYNIIITYIFVFNIYIYIYIYT